MAILQSTVISGGLLLKKIGIDLSKLTFSSGSNTASILLISNNTLRIQNQISSSGQFISGVNSGSSPFIINSPTLVNNLNSNYLNGKQDYQFLLTAGIYNSPTLTSNGSGSIIIGSGSYVTFSDTNFNSPIMMYNMTSSIQGLTDNALNYVMFDNNHDPKIFVSTDRSSINQSSVIPICSVFRSGNILHTLSWDQMAKGLSNKISDRLVRTRRFLLLLGGLSLGLTGTRNVTVTSGYVWHAAVRDLLDAYDSSINYLLLLYHTSAGVWSSSIVTQYNNSQYDDGTKLVSLSPSKYAVNWVFRGVLDLKHCYIVLGNGNYNSSEAQSATMPNIPTIISSHAILVGRIIVQNGNSSAYLILSAFNTQFTSLNTGVTYVSITGSNGIITSIVNPTTLPSMSLSLGNITPISVTTGTSSAYRFISTVPTGISPISASSTTLCPNLNADYVGGFHENYFLNTSSTDQTKTGQITAKTFKLINDSTDTSAHRYSLYDGGVSSNQQYGMMLWNSNGVSGDWGPMIYTPNVTGRRISFGLSKTSSFNTHADVTLFAYFLSTDKSLNLTGQIKSNLALGTAPISVSSTTMCTNLNSDLLDGLHSSGIFNQVMSKGQNLVTNGSALLGNNTNFSQFIFDGSEAISSNGSFRKLGGYTQPSNDEFIPVDASLSYRLSFYAKSLLGTGRYYTFLYMYDVDGKPIDSTTHMYQTGTTTTLSSSLNNGDTEIHLTSAANWNNTSADTWKRSVILWNYTNSFGYTYPSCSYSRNWYADLWNTGSINYATNTIPLKVPWANGTVPAGTALSNGSAGGTYKYFILAYNLLSTSWTKYTGTMKGTDYSGTNANYMFNPGTSTIRLGILSNTTGVVGEKSWWTNFSFGLDDIDGNAMTLNGTSSISFLNTSSVAQTKFGNLTILGDYGSGIPTLITSTNNLMTSSVAKDLYTVQQIDSNLARLHLRSKDDGNGSSVTLTNGLHNFILTQNSSYGAFHIRYYSSSNSTPVDIVSNGTDYFTIKRNGYTGINTNTPYRLLTVYDNTIGSNDLLSLRKFSSVNGDSVAINFGVATDQPILYVGSRIRFIRGGSNSFGDLLFLTKLDSTSNIDTTLRMRIKNDGKVGIGVTTPSQNLLVSGSIQSNLSYIASGSVGSYYMKTTTSGFIIGRT